jgi:hypothetical protein
MNSQLGAAELGNLELGQLPISDNTLSPGAGSIALTGGTPTLSFSGSFSLAPGAGSITLTGGTPTVSLFDGTVSPGAGSIVLTPGTPVASYGGTISLAPAAGAIALTGGTPGVFTDTGIPAHPLPYSLTITGGTPTLGIVLAPGAGTIRLTTTAPGISLVRTTGTGNQLYIGDTLYNWKESTFRITKTLGGQWSASFDLNFTGGFDPDDLIDEEVSMFWNGVKRYGGVIQSIEEVGYQGNIAYSTLKVTCAGYISYLDRVIYAKLVTLPLGGVTGIAVYNFWYEKLAQFGLSKVGDAPNTFMPEQLFHYITGTEVMNRIKDQDPGYDYWVDDNKEFHYALTDPSSGPSAPFSITDADVTNSDFMSVKRSNVRFRNRQFVLPSADLIALRDDARVGDGSTSFSTDYPLNSPPIVRVAGVAQIVTEFGVWIDGWQFYYVRGGIGVFAAAAPGVGDAVDILYPSPYPLAEMAEDAASISAVGPYEAIWQAKNVFDRPTAQAIAQGLLELYGPNAAGGYPKEIDVEYNSDSQPAWLDPGMIVSFNKTFPTAVGNFAVEEVSSQEMKLTVWKHSVKLRAGLGDVGEALALQAYKTSSRVPIDSPPYRLGWSLFEDIQGLTNPGAAVGAIKQTNTVQCAGVVTSWNIIFPDDPPTGADFQMDVKVNGVSILPSDPTQKVVVPDGSTELVQGLQFLVDNTPVTLGDLVTLEVIQVGSDFGGANCTFTLNVKVPANPGQV